MVVYEGSEEQTNRIFRALADPTRRDIVRRTVSGEASVSELAAAYDMSFAAVQKHVAVLEAAGLVAKEQRGRERIVRGRPEVLRHVHAVLDELELLWRTRMQQLDDLFAQEAEADAATRPHDGTPPPPVP
ncbi:winged helix-turn-helix transcriptional regulator [Propioniciclava coleopterorum]|uniref:Winged helix-turn-helix transcriptional regulator n=1 Tax=Propioniciclava coleopterorum TaxID=2714937 RepID=A0A6G7Y7F2_9ACTN|nr:metalloregulator ArsR/SmtB family transcription factor [Propioniciclava coleopterorum]QIK72745.1 winged helix-turn-helix transcriptional regulator [Propioniciclava coleopterorum]